MVPSQALLQESGPAVRRRRAQLIQSLPPAGESLRASLVERYVKCGKPAHCAANAMVQSGI